MLPPPPPPQRAAFFPPSIPTRLIYACMGILRMPIETSKREGREKGMQQRVDGCLFTLVGRLPLCVSPRLLDASLLASHTVKPEVAAAASPTP